ncbi:hypothetical protein [Aquimarina algicola]|uniref:TonB C-terminal domain-containing protein n=1 Tax=Aquimarina algicola TaxID=2589995 RepID=A0A504JFP9_9FLAO|nr:hypothetical protein [Aquimarina algicola]TPN87265.1 hypothetical protein FHK87_06675 [Aquimarina algicola]
MKKLFAILILLIMNSISVFATDNTPIVSQKQLRAQIEQLLKDPDIFVENEELNAKIEFTLNTKGQIVVLSVDAEESNVEEYIKSRLNYKKINPKISSLGSNIYKISLRILKPEEA